MRTGVGVRSPLDLSAAQALRDAIGDYDPVVHNIRRPGAQNRGAAPGNDSTAPTDTADTRAPTPPPGRDTTLEREVGLLLAAIRSREVCVGDECSTPSALSPDCASVFLLR